MSYEEFAEELRKWWSFDDRQQYTHSWHSREDFIEHRLPKMLHDFAEHQINEYRGDLRS